MKHASTTLLAVLLALVAACSPTAKDEVIHVKDDDPEMLAAIAKARTTLPQFWKVFEKPENGETDFALKVKITDKNGVEHFWLTELERTEGKIMGTINNDPGIVASVKLGDRIPVPEADITDWLYMRGGKMVGNKTLKPLFKSMPDEEARKLKSIMADP